MLARSKKRLTKTKEVKPRAKNEGDFLRDKLRLDIFFQLINLFVRLLIVFLLVMGGSQTIFISKEVPFITMMLLIWFGLKINSLLEVMRL